MKKPIRGNKVYTAEELELLKNPLLSHAKVAKAIGRTAWAVQLKRIAISKDATSGVPTSRRKYSQKEIEILLDKRYSDKAVAVKLNRTVQAVTVKRSKLKNQPLEEDIIAVNGTEWEYTGTKSFEVQPDINLSKHKSNKISIDIDKDTLKSIKVTTSGITVEYL